MDNNPKHLAKVAVVIQPGFVPLDVAVPQQVFGRWPDHLAAARPGGTPYELTLASPASAEGPLLPREVEPLDRLDTADTVIVTGVEDPAVPPEAELVERLRDAYERGSRMVSICTGAFALAAAGVLDGLHATTHWKHIDEFERDFPAVEVDRDVLYVDEGDVLTSAGVCCGIDLCLHIVRRDLGAATANQMARGLVAAPHRDGGQAQYVPAPVAGTDDTSLARTRAWALERVDQPLTI
ncbi:GlxA family transcriptional regulator, partial [Streptomyces milbemycinicus]